jgi:hypothetical protein
MQPGSGSRSRGYFDGDRIFVCARLFARAVAPAELRRFAFPALPESLAAWRPGDRVRVGVGLIDNSAIAGYRDLARRGLDSLEDLDDGATLRISASGPLSVP